MREIIVPIGFGLNSANAARYAADIALVIGSGIRLVYFLQSPSFFTRHQMPDPLFRKLRANASVLLNTLCDEISKRTGGKVRVNSDLETGDAGQSLSAYCDQFKPFLVVMGVPRQTPGQNPEPDLAVKAMNHLPHPLLIVPESSAFHNSPNVVIACDEEDIDSGLSSVLPFLKELRKLLGSRFEVVHVADDGENITAALKSYEGWKKDLEALGPELQLVRQTSVEDGINDYLENHAADWLLVLPKKHSTLEFHKSRAEDILLHCPMPVLSLHE